jgi:hypothetical protein
MDEKCGPNFLPVDHWSTTSFRGIATSFGGIAEKGKP